jgi:ribose transport system substrate-binding protein
MAYAKIEMMERGRTLLKTWFAVSLALLMACSPPKPPTPMLGSSVPRSSGLASASSVDTGRISISRRWRIAFIPKFKLLAETGHLSAYWLPAWEGARETGKALGLDVELITGDAKGTDDDAYVEPQIALIDALIRSHRFDGLVLAPFDSNRLAPVVDKAVAAGIPTVVIDTPLCTERAFPLVTFDNRAAGRVIGAWVAHKMGSGKSALILSGPTDERNAVDRRDGIIDGLQGGGARILDIRSANWEVETARAAVKFWLGEFSSFGAIVAANDNMAIGAAEALEDAGKKGVLVTGFDATEDGVAALKSGRIAATVDQAPGLQARLAIRLLARRLEGTKAFPPVVALDEIHLVEAGNLESWLAGKN